MKAHIGVDAESGLTHTVVTTAAAEHGCKRRGVPSRFGNWHTYTPHEPLDRVFKQLQRSQRVRIRLEAVSLDSTVLREVLAYQSMGISFLPRFQVA